MATPTLYMLPLTILVQYLTNLGVIAAGATLTILEAGSVSTLVDTFSDSTGLVPNANPLTLNAAGRPANPTSGAQIAFWVPSGTVIDVYFQDVQGEAWSIKNMSGMNDPAVAGSLQTLLASPASSNASGVGPVAGVDLVANAVKSYDVIADVRAANAPLLASGQTLCCLIQGGNSINDGLGGLFYWNATSTTPDNGTTVLQPNSESGAGRWLRMYIPPEGVQTTIAAATTTDLGTLATNVVTISGTATITSFGNAALNSRSLFHVTFQSAGTQLTFNTGSMILPGGKTIFTQAGDSAILLNLGSGNWRMLAYFRGVGVPVTLVSTADQPLVSSTVLTTITSLAAVLVAGGTYLAQFRIQLLGTGSTGIGWKFQATFGGTLTGLSTGIGVASGNLTPAPMMAALGSVMSNAANSDTTPDMIALDYVIRVNAAGTLTAQFAQDSSDPGPLTALAGSQLIVTRLA